MAGYIIAGTSLAAIFAFLFYKPSRIIYMKRLALPLICIAFIACLVLFSKTALAAASKGINLWFGIVFPSLFPFFAASEILCATGFIKAAGLLLEPVMRPLFNVPGAGSFALAMGVTSGYPVGARITCDLREKGTLTKTEAERLLAFTNNSGPLFIIGAVATGMYKTPSLGIFLLGCHILACLTVGMLFRYYKRDKHSKNDRYQMKILKKFKKELISQNDGKNINTGMVISDAIKNSVTLILMIGGYIILFSVIINLLLETGFIRYLADVFSILLAPLGLNSDMISAVISGFFEITTGTNLVSGIKYVASELQLSATSLIIGWAGLSVHFQVFGIVSKTDISIKPYLFGKLLQGIIAAIYTWAGIKFLGLDFPMSIPVSASGIPAADFNWQSIFMSSCLYLLATLAVFMLFYIFIRTRLLKRQIR